MDVRLEFLMILGIGCTLLAAGLGWLGGRTVGERALREARGEALYFRRKAGEAEREMASLKVKREQKVVELLEQLRVVETDRRALLGEVAGLKTEREGLEGVLHSERVATRDRVGLLQDGTHRLEGIFRALSSEAVKLGEQTQALEELLSPLRESLERYDAELREMERRRVELYGGLRQRLDVVAGAQQRLRLDTGSLVQALLYERLAKLLEYFEELRRTLERSVETGPGDPESGNGRGHRPMEAQRA